MKKNNFYVYIHVKPNNGEIFYVGKGRGKRAYEQHKNRRSKFWKRVVNKYGLDVFILENNLTEDEAFELEKKYIKRIGRRDLNTGTLVNMTDGGEGAAGHSEETIRKISEGNKGKKMSDEARRKISEAMKGNKHTKGMKHSDKTRQKMSEAAKGNKYGKGNKGKKHSEETRRKISEANKRRIISEETRMKLSEAAKKWWADRKAKVVE